MQFVIAIHGNWIPANPRFALPAEMADFLVLGELFCCSLQYFIMAKVDSRQDHHEWLNFKLSRLTWIACFSLPP
jgi:hypothetical protein